MMRIDIISAVPDLLTSPLGHSIVKRAIDKQLVEVHVHNLRDYSSGKYKQIDDYPFGGGAGMVIMAEPISKCIKSLQAERTYDAVIYTSPDGKVFDQPTANSWSLFKNIIILCGHYKGVDERVRNLYITHEISIGDYVLTGGELAAAVITDAVVRLIPGVIGDETSALTDSFQDGLLAPPVYTRPEEFEGLRVPEVLMSGNHAKIDAWRHQQALERTEARRPDIYQKLFVADN